MSYKEDLSNAISYAKYDKAAELFKIVGKEETESILTTLSFEQDDITTYGFAIYMIEKDKGNKVFWLEMAIFLMEGPFCWIEGGYYVALHHMRQLLEEEYSVENLTHLLSFNEIPGKLVSDQEAIKIAKEILLLDPNNEIANEYLKKSDINSVNKK